MLLPAWIGANETAMASRMPLKTLALRGGLARAADAFAVAGDDDLEVAVAQRVRREEPLAVDDEAGVGVAGDVFRLVVEADPGRGHGVGVDVVQQVLDAEILHLQVELAAELPADELRDPWSGTERASRGESVMISGGFIVPVSVDLDDVRRIARATIPYAVADALPRGSTESRSFRGGRSTVARAEISRTEITFDYRRPAASGHGGNAAVVLHGPAQSATFTSSSPSAPECTKWIGHPDQAERVAELVLQVALDRKSAAARRRWRRARTSAGCDLSCVT